MPYRRLLLIVLLLSLGACASNRHQVKQESAGIFAIYGNWCGPDHPKVMEPPPEPLDLLDTACMHHDYCYVEKGYLNCDCDKALVKELKRNLADRKFNAEQRKYALSIENYFKASPCENAAAQPEDPAQESTLSKVYNSTKGGFNKLLDLVGGDDAQAAPAPETAPPAVQSPSAEQSPPAEQPAPATADQPKVWY